jgi:hypothetical protein
MLPKFKPKKMICSDSRLKKVITVLEAEDLEAVEVVHQVEERDKAGSI